MVAEWVHAAADGDEAAWGALVDRFNGLVWSVIQGYRMGAADAADVSQTTWLRLAENIHRIREPEHVGSWLATTAGRECLRVLHQNQRQVPTEEVYFNDVADPDSHLEPETAALTLERDEVLWAALGEMPPRAQVLLGMLFADSPPTYEEISTATGMPVGSIGPTRGRYLAQLRARPGILELQRA
jgi:RNA polymerase sigma factor (sigma-70 family)